MILAEKIIKLRKQNGWSQEELAMQMNVSRQSVSKWESGTSIPDLNKIIRLSEIFNVSIDILVKDEKDILDTQSQSSNQEEIILNEHYVTLKEANNYMNLMKKSALKIAIGVSLCILSPVCLIFLSGIAESSHFLLKENFAAGIGIVILLIMVAVAVGIFISTGMHIESYSYMEKENLSFEYNVAGIVEHRREKFSSRFQKCIITGVVLCILSVVPLMVAVALEYGDLSYIYGIVLLLIFVSIGVFFFVWSGIIKDSYDKLLEEGEYTREKKLKNRQSEDLSKVYWCTITAIYLGFSFLTSRWEITWILWPCAGVLYAALCAILSMKKNKNL